jgi:transposase
MQGKEASEQEANVKSSAGVDVSKDWLDADVWPCDKRLRVANTPEGIRKLKRWLQRFDLIVVIIEATGKWHRLLWRSLVQSNIPVAVIDPYKARMFAKALGILAKTDQIDASVLSRYGYMVRPAVRPPQPQVIEQLAELVGGRDAAVAEQTRLHNQLSAATVEFFRKQLRQRLARLDKDIAELEEEILARITADTELSRRYEIVISIPGIGPAVAATLVVRLSELGSVPDKQITMLAGLAPIADKSGKHDGKRVIWGGRAAVRRMLYLAAISAKQWNPTLKPFYDRLKENGKETKVALVAVARKLVILANTLIAEDRTWQKIPPQNA